jgi:hypothetical protein
MYFVVRPVAEVRGEEVGQGESPCEDPLGGYHHTAKHGPRSEIRRQDPVDKSKITFTVKKERKIFLINKEIQKGRVQSHL